MPISIRKIIHSPRHAPCTAGMPYNQAIQVGRTIYVSGQLGLDPITHSLVPGIEGQTDQAILNMAEVLKEAKASLKDVIKTTIAVRDISDLATVSEVYAKHFGPPPSINNRPSTKDNHLPARTSYQALELPRGALVEIEAVAVVGARTAGTVWQY